MDTMIYCRVNVIMQAFKASPTAGVPADVVATMEITDQTPAPDGGTAYFYIDGSSLKVSVPTGIPARIEYHLKNSTQDLATDIFYIFGMFYSNAAKHLETDIGAFPVVLIAGDVPVTAQMDGDDITPQPYTVSVVDQNDTTGLWSYTIGIQDLNTGAIGMFDPEIENEEQEE